MGRRKKRRTRRAPPRAAKGAAAEAFELEIVDDTSAHPHPHPLDDVASALERSTDHSANAWQRPAAEATPETQRAPDAAASETPSTPPSTPAGAEETSGERIDPGSNVQTIGELLQQAREARGLSVQETSSRTRISTIMLQHLENDRFGELPADTYVKGFLRSYGGFLGLDVGMLLRRYETLSGRAVETAPEIWEEVEVAPKKRHVWRPRRRTWTLPVLLALAAGLAWVFWSRGAARLGLRPTRGLQQIENELRGTRAQPLDPTTTIEVDLPEDTAPAVDSTGALAPAADPGEPSQPQGEPPARVREPSASPPPRPSQAAPRSTTKKPAHPTTRADSTDSLRAWFPKAPILE
ncbi:MAG: helix-turn-helix domain-containing protein [Candidatus Latescibacterota bacterium]|nr:MAG: helix-turn-helix domain-containing protein [Candidatus Latescibacterota bacterium]